MAYLSEEEKFDVEAFVEKVFWDLMALNRHRVSDNGTYDHPALMALALILIRMSHEPFADRSPVLMKHIGLVGRFAAEGLVDQWHAEERKRLHLEVVQ